MKIKPSPYFVEYSGIFEGDWKIKNFDTLSDAKKWARELNRSCWIYERFNLRDITPARDPRGLLWDWEEKLVKEL